MRLPRPRDFSAFAGFEWFAAAFIHPFGNADRMITVLAVNPACTGFIVLFKVHAIKLLVFIDDAGPAINAHHRNNAVLLIREGVNFFRPRIKAVLVGDDQQCDELRIAGITFKCRLAKSGDQFLWVDRIHADTFSQLPCQRCECCTHPFYTSESISTWW
ncbi:hypothetical protein BvCmsKKNP010_00101 [Escherichia coli]|nr:hypothetical protein BvCmsKKNP010_00101 [Escherichia coli]